MWEWKTCQFGWSHCENQSENSGISCSRGSGPESGGLSWAENSLEVDDQVWTWQDGQGLERPQPFITEGGGCQENQDDGHRSLRKRPLSGSAATTVLDSWRTGALDGTERSAAAVDRAGAIPTPWKARSAEHALLLFPNQTSFC